MADDDNGWPECGSRNLKLRILMRRNLEHIGANDVETHTILSVREN